jgi:hypothetical protein
MSFPRILSAIVVAGAATLAVPGCSSNSNAPPAVGMVWNVDVGADGAGMCPVGGGDTFTIGGGAPYDSVVNNGDTSGGAPVTVSCKVASSGGGFDLALNAAKGTAFGSIQITGHVDGTTNDQPNINAQFQDNLTMIANLAEQDCVISFPDTAHGQGIAAGRIWGHIDCPHAADSSRGRKCDANADFRFENCSQN